MNFITNFLKNVKAFNAGSKFNAHLVQALSVLLLVLAPNVLSIWLTIAFLGDVNLTYFLITVIFIASAIGFVTFTKYMNKL